MSNMTLPSNRNAVFLAVAAILLSASGSMGQFINSVKISPEPPTANDKLHAEVSVQFTEACDFSAVTDIALIGNHITLDIFWIRPPTACPQVLVNQTHSFPLGYLPPGQYSLQVNSFYQWGFVNEREITFDVVPNDAVTSITGRYVFYNNSYFDGYYTDINTTIGPKTDSAAIDPSKRPLMTGDGKAVFANWTGYIKGINGLAYDVVLAASSADPEPSDFAFRNIGRLGTDAYAISPLSSGKIILREANPRIVRMVFAFGDGGVKNSWLQVDIGEGFGAPAETHYWGNAAADVGIGNADTCILVSVSDELAIRSHPSTALNRSAVSDPYDVNKDSLVNAQDQLYTRANTILLPFCVKVITR